MKYIGMNISLGEGGYDFLDESTILRIGDTKDKDGGKRSKRSLRGLILSQFTFNIANYLGFFNQISSS